MNRKRILRTVLIFIVLITNVSCDQISKNIVRDRISNNEYVSVVQHYFTLTRIENTGAFLSAGNNMPQPYRLILLTVLPLIVMLASLVYIIRKKTLPCGFVIGICFIIGGGMGNIYDRVVYGSVTDFMHLDFGFFQTGIFNMADVSIMAGGALVLIASYLNDRKIKAVERVNEQ